MSIITKEEVQRIADLARIEITNEEADRHLNYVEMMETYADKLNEIDTKDVKPTTHGVEFKNIMRKDEPVKWATQEQVLDNSPDHAESHFRVPTILE